ELGRPDVVSVELGNLGALEVLDGNISAAVPFLRESLEIAYKRGDRYLAPYELVWLGRVALAEGNPARGATLFAAARTQFDATGLAMDPDEGPEYEKGLAAIQEALDEKAFSAAWATGKKRSLDAAAASRRSVRKVRRTDDGPIERAGGDQLFHPGEVGVWFPKDPADQVDQDPRAPSFDGGNAHGDDAPHARFPHGREFGTCHVADDGRWSAAFRGHNRDHCVLPTDCTSDVLEVSTVSTDYHPQSRAIGQCVGPTR